MLTFYCDESDDGQTYVLAGWLGSPTGWEHFDPAWRAMLQTITMPDGWPCPAFHAAEIVGRDQIKDSRFKGWTFADEVAAFTKATDLICDVKNGCALMWPIGVATELPSSFTWVQRDSIWLILFMRFFQLILETYPAQRSFRFLFDSKPEIADYAQTVYGQAKKILDPIAPDHFESEIAFGFDQDHPGLQAADLLAYEWRKRISDARLKPHKAVRKSYERIRAARPDGALWRFAREVFDEALKADDQSTTWAHAVMYGPPTHRD
jgi:hypothetical protein